MDLENKLSILLLCGGKSSRAGFEKSLFNINGKPWAQRLFELTKKILPGVLISINKLQYSNYQILFNSNILILDSVNVKGPLNGILSAHNNYKEMDFLVLAVDLLNINESILLKLIQVYKSNPGYDFYAWKKDEHIEPLCGIYSSKGLKKINQIIPELTNFSIIKILESSNTYFIPIQEEEIKYFKNFNYPEDFQ